jgi:hypothetical protein
VRASAAAAPCLWLYESQLSGSVSLHQTEGASSLQSAADGAFDSSCSIGCKTSNTKERKRTKQQFRGWRFPLAGVLGLLSLPLVIAPMRLQSPDQAASYSMSSSSSSAI